LSKKKIVGFIQGMGPRDSVNNVILAIMSLLNVENRYKQLSLNHVFKIVNNQCPSYMKENLYLLETFILIQLGRISTILGSQEIMGKIM
jgi:hypothetical protein